MNDSGVSDHADYLFLDDHRQRTPAFRTMLVLFLFELLKQDLLK